MSTPRAAVKLASLAAGIGLAALLSGPGFAADDAVAAGHRAARAAGRDPDDRARRPPEAPRAAETASPEPAAAPTVKAQTSPAPAPAAEIALPELPEAPALFTVADQLGAAIAARLADAKFQLAPKLAKKDREAIAAFYALGDYKPLWLKDEAWTPAALAVAARLGKAAEDGLDPADYPVPALGAAADKAGRPRRGRLEALRRGGALCPRRPRRARRSGAAVTADHAEARAAGRRRRADRVSPPRRTPARRSSPTTRRMPAIAPSRQSWRRPAASRRGRGSRATSSPTWSAGAGCPPTWAGATSG